MAARLFLPRGSARLPRAVANALYQIVAMVAQQFEGYIFTVNVEEVRNAPLLSAFFTCLAGTMWAQPSAHALLLAMFDSHGLAVLGPMHSEVLKPPYPKNPAVPPGLLCFTSTIS